MPELTETDLQWNRMWMLWAYEGLDSPLQELLTYQAEVSNGGHAQYFSNVGAGELAQLERILSPPLYANVLRAYRSCQTDDDKALDQCDTFFQNAEEEITGLLQGYASAFA